MPFVERIEKLLINNQIKEVIDEFLKFLSEVPQSNKDARNDANQLRGQVIVLSGRFTDLSNKINTQTLGADAASQERNALTNSFVQILNQLSSNYPDLNKYVEEKDEDEDWFDAQKKNNIETYHAYFNKYPNGKYKADTIKLISELEEVKQKQESEMKRLAMLEKERRENDKLAAEQKQATSSSPVKPVIKPSAAEGSIAAATKSKKGLLIGVGVLVLAVIAFFIFRGGKADSANQGATSENIPVEELYDTMINPAVYYYIQNRDNKKIAGVIDGRVDDFIPLVLYDSAGKSAKDYVKFKLEPASTDPNNKWFFIIPKHSNKTITLSDINNAIQGNEVTKSFVSNFWGKSTFYFDLKPSKYFNISISGGTGDNTKWAYWMYDKQNMANTEGAPIFLKGFGEGENMDWGESDFGQWRLIPTGEPVKD